MHRFPSSHAPVFLEWHLKGVVPLPPPAATTTTVRMQGPPVGRCARGTRTATLDYVQKTLHLGALLLATQDGLSESLTRREVRPADPALCPLRFNPAEVAIRASTTRPARSALSQHAVTLPDSRFASHSIAPQAASASPGSTSAAFCGTSDRLGIIPEARHTGIKTELSAACWS